MNSLIFKMLANYLVLHSPLNAIFLFLIKRRFLPPLILTFKIHLVKYKLCNLFPNIYLNDPDDRT